MLYYKHKVLTKQIDYNGRGFHFNGLLTLYQNIQNRFFFLSRIKKCNIGTFEFDLRASDNKDNNQDDDEKSYINYCEIGRQWVGFEYPIPQTLNMS